MEAHDAYACTLILGLCHSPPRLENQSGSWKIENLMEEKTISFRDGGSTQKPAGQEKNGCCCVTYIFVCDRKCKLSMERET